MIAVVDAWGDSPPPPGASDADDLFLAAHMDGAVVIGDRGGLASAQQIGVRVIEHIGISPRLPRSFQRRRIQQQLRVLQHDTITPMTIWCAGMLDQPLRHPDAVSAPKNAEPEYELGPFVLPLASDPAVIDACTLVLAAALTEAANGSCLMGLPPGIGSQHRSRRLLSSGDRVVPVEPLPLAGPRYIGAADVILDFGLSPDGPIDAAVKVSGCPRVRLDPACPPFAVAAEIKRLVEAGMHV